jgi:hypothetical protein
MDISLLFIGCDRLFTRVFPLDSNWKFVRFRAVSDQALLGGR